MVPLVLARRFPQLLLISPRLIRQKPLFLGRFFLRLVTDRFAAQPKLRSILFHTHYRCNLHCQHCYEKNFTRNNGPLLSLSEKKQAIEQCLDAGALSFDFVAGESSLDPDLLELVQTCRPSKTYVTLASNGYALSAAFIRQLKNAGVDKINLSLDSWFADEHNRLRGKEDAFQRVFACMDDCREVGMSFNLTVFVYRHFTRAEGFQRLIDFAVEKRIRLAFKTAVPLGQLAGNYADMVTEEDRQCLHQLHRQYPFLARTCVATPQCSCPGFSRMVTVTAYGDVLPCNAVHVSFGNIKTTPLGEIVQQGREIEYFNGHYRGCPSSDDIEFVKSYLAKSFEATPYPVGCDKVFGQDQQATAADKAVACADSGDRCL